MVDIKDNRLNRCNMKGIRLTDSQVLEICKAFRSTFLMGDRLWLFGSRADLSKKGGDIDLYIETSLDDPGEIVKSRLGFLAKLEIAIGEQKIDVAVKYGDFELDIYKVARKQGIQLI